MTELVLMTRRHYGNETEDGTDNSNVVKVLLERKGSSVTTLLSIYNYTSRIPLFLCK